MPSPKKPTPAQVPQSSPAKSKLAAKYGAKLTQAVQAHANDETDYGFIPLPPGINNGIARLKRLYFEQYKKGDNVGQYYLRGVAVVLEPEFVMVNGSKMKTKGLFTSVMCPVCETRNSKGEVTSQESNMAVILNHYRMLGGDGCTDGVTGDDLEELAETIEGEHPVFKFTTSPKFAQKDEGQVKKGDVTGAWENWHGTLGLEDYVPPDEQGFDSDGGGDTPTDPEPTPAPTPKPVPKKPTVATSPTPKPTVKPKAPVAPQPPQEEVTDPTEVTNEDGSSPFDEGSLNALAEDAASDSDTSVESGDELTRLAIETGVPEKKVKEANTWTSVIKMILDMQPTTVDDGTTEGGDDAQPEGWKKGDVCLYSPNDPKTKRPVKTPIQCKIVSVNEESQVATLQAGKTSYKDIPLDKLEVPTESAAA